MRLSKIKISGFKSFVDPITFSLSSNLTGIVGPNGCGKSNIIDALSWVLGECSARHLRGEHLADVIFNGSSQRKALGQASVELVFDNSKQRISGQYADWSEIAIKRQIARDGISAYFLNGIRCRRRDIVSLFLGTGLGAGGYAIIEQGMISSLIEARPEELRGYIEEAAGISKYRQRRREAANRMRRTEENMDRVNDMVVEIDARLANLNKQAQAAGKFQALKQQARQLRLECLALDWQARRRQTGQYQQQVQQRKAASDAGFAEKSRLETQLEELQEELRQANQLLNEQQARSYRISSEIVQGEQALQYSRRRCSEIEANLAQIERRQSQMSKEQEADAQQITAIAAQLRELQPQTRAARQGCDQAAAALGKAEQNWQDWQNEWQERHRRATDHKQQQQLIGARLEHLQTSLQHNMAQQKRLAQESAALAGKKLAQRRGKQQAHYRELQQQQQRHRQDCQTLQDTLQQHRSRVARLGDFLDQRRAQQHALRGRIGALETLQDEQSGKQDPKLQNWLDKRDLADRARLVERIEVEPDWIHAFETVAAPFLQYLCVEDLTALLQDQNLHEVQAGFVTRLENGAQNRKRARLVDKIRRPAHLPAWLGAVYIANDLPAALRLRKTLAAHESVISKQGVWLGPNYLITGKVDQESGMLRRARAMEAGRAEMERIGKTISTLQQKKDQAHTRLQKAEKQQGEQQARLEQTQDLLADAAALLASTKTQIEQNQERRQRIREDLDGLRRAQQEMEQEMDALKTRLQDADDEPSGNWQDTLARQRARHGQALEQARRNWQNSHQQSDALSLRFDTLASRKTVLEQAQTRLTRQLANLKRQDQELRAALQKEQSPLPEMNQTAQEKQIARNQADTALGAAREALHVLQEKVRAVEQERHRHEKDCQQLLADLQQAQLEHKEQQVRLETITNQLAELDQADPEQLLKGMDAGAELRQWQEKLTRLQRRLESMTTVNLGAVDECRQLQERRDYLDAQRVDLRQALEILDAAITRLDRETRSRFRQTFEQINDNLAETFPQLFGGGRCRLELGSHDLLTTGVQVNARPPGKRAATIHLLSGGEKALTAIALVFAIFKLNPAPFCILDEVDAPLDDHNANRFSEMLLTLSRDVQFLFVTHNKITMEIAERLIGVTMQEAGVSKLVSVDMEQAAPVAVSA